MQPEPTMKNTVRILLVGASLAAAHGLVARDVEIELRNPAVESGEPVIIAVTLQNDTGAAEQSLPVGPAEVDWIVKSQEGAEVAHWQPSGEMLSLIHPMPPQAVRTFLVVAAATAGIRQPGSYEMTVHYRYLDVTRQVWFTVVPSSPASLSRRAQALHDAAAVSGEDGRTAGEALANMAYAVPSSLLCDVLTRNRSASYAIVTRLGAAGDRDAGHCLIGLLSTGPFGRQEIYPVLEPLAKSTRDPALRRDIENAVAGK
jgi:hypothetical protein